VSAPWEAAAGAPETEGEERDSDPDTLQKDGESSDDGREERVVTTEAPRPPQTASETDIGTAELSTVPARSAEHLVERVPHVSQTQHGSEGKGHQFYLRGFDAVHGSDLSVSVDGVPINEASNVHGHGYLDFHFLIPEVVRGLEVRRGVYALDQGDFASAGSMDFELGVPEAERGLRLSYGYGSTDRHRGLQVWAPETGDGGTFLAAELIGDRGFGPNREMRRFSTVGRATIWESRNWAATATAIGYGSEFGLAGPLRLDDYRVDRIEFRDSYTVDTGGESRRGIGSMRLRGRPGPWEVDAAVWGQLRALELDQNFTGRLRFPVRGDRNLQSEHRESLGLELEVGRTLLPTLELRGLAGATTEAIRQSQRRLDDNGRVWHNDFAHDVSQQHLWAGFGADWSPLHWLRLIPSVRIDGFRRQIEPAEGNPADRWLGAPSPRISANVFAGRAWTISAAYGRGLRSPPARAVLPNPAEPDSEERYYRGGRPRITRTRNAEIGLRWAPRWPLELRTAVFGIWVDEETIFDHASGVNLELGSTRRLGAELEVSGRPREWLQLRGGGTAVRARFLDSMEKIPGAPRLMTTAAATLAHPDGWRAGSQFRALGPRPLPYGARSRASATLDGMVGYRWPQVQLDLEVANVFDANVRDGAYHYASSWNSETSRSRLPAVHYTPGAPRTLMVRVSLWSEQP